jgi:hypothetical protein
MRRVLDYMEDRRKRQNREAAFIFGGCLVLFSIIAAVMFVVVTIFNAIESSTVNRAYGEVASACDPFPVGQESVDNLPSTESPREILLMIGNTQRRHAWHSQVPVAWRAESGEEVGLVGCIEEDWVELETCEYLRDSARGQEPFTIRIDREQHQIEIVLINPENDRRIDSQTVLGGEPLPCPEDNESITTSGNQRGAEVVFQDVAPWVEGYVFDD